MFPLESDLDVRTHVGVKASAWGTSLHNESIGITSRLYLDFSSRHSTLLMLLTTEAYLKADSEAGLHDFTNRFIG